MRIWNNGLNASLLTNSLQVLHLPGKMHAFLVPPCEKTFLKTTELSVGQKQYLAGDEGEKMFNE